jgi:SEC-C motif family protein
MLIEKEIFNLLSDLCAKPGFIHALVDMHFSDNYFKADEKNNFTVSQVAKHEADRSKLNRNEVNTLLALVIKNNKKFIMDKLPNEDVLIEYKIQAYRLLEQFHNILTEGSRNNFIESLSSVKLNEIKSIEKDIFINKDFLREAIFYSGDGVYDFQYQWLGFYKYRHDNNWISENKGFSVDWLNPRLPISFFNIIFHLHHQKTDKLKPISINDFIYSKYEIINFITELFGDDAGRCFPVDVMLNFMTSFSIDDNLMTRFEKFNEFDDFNPIVAFPFIKLGDEKYFLLDIYTLAQAFYETPFFWFLEDKEYKNTASDNRGQFTEEFTYQILCHAFGKENVWINVDLYPKSNQIQSQKDKAGEIDILVNIQGTALVFQAKSKKLTLDARKGNISKINSDFASSIQAAYNQSFECSRILLSNNYIAKIDGIEIAIPEVNYCIPICVLSEHFPALTAQIRWFLKENTDLCIAQALVLDVFLLQLMQVTLKTPLEFLHFIFSLSKVRKNFLSNTQIDLLSQHLIRNILCSNEADMYMLDNGVSAQLDLYLTQEFRGIKFNKNDMELPSCWLKYQNTYWYKLFEFCSSLDTSDKVSFGLELMRFSEEDIESYNNLINKINSNFILDRSRKFSDFHISFNTNFGITVYVYQDVIVDKIFKNQVVEHAKLSKYRAKADLWAGLIVSTTGSVKYIKVVNNKWEFNNELQTKIQKLVSKSKPKILVNKKIIARKIGRNDPCPCNSGKKYKKCCLR